MPNADHQSFRGQQHVKALAAEEVTHTLYILKYIAIVTKLSGRLKKKLNFTFAIAEAQMHKSGYIARASQ